MTPSRRVSIQRVISATVREAVKHADSPIGVIATAASIRSGGFQRELEKACPGAEVKKGLPITGSQAANAGAEVKKWLSANGLL